MNDYSTFLQGDGIAIFLFHGVIPEKRHKVRNYTNKHLERGRFVSILRSLCANGIPISMNDIVGAFLNRKELPRRAFAITFDDGFENNYSIAAPVLQDFGIPTTFYVTTDFIESNAASWIDMIEYAVEKKEKFWLKLPFLAVHALYEEIEQKHDLLEKIRDHVKNDPTIDPYKLAHDIWNQLGIPSMEVDPELDRKMSWTQLQNLSEEGLFKIGGHGHTHRILSYLEPSELEREVATSVERLRTQLGITIQHYSYPEGLASCYSSRVIDVLKEHGIVCAPSAEHGINHIGDDLFHLKRIMVSS